MAYDKNYNGQAINSYCPSSFGCDRTVSTKSETSSYVLKTPKTQPASASDMQMPIFGFSEFVAAMVIPP